MERIRHCVVTVRRSVVNSYLEADFPTRSQVLKESRLMDDLNVFDLEEATGTAILIFKGNMSVLY